VTSAWLTPASCATSFNPTTSGDWRAKTRSAAARMRALGSAARARGSRWTRQHFRDLRRAHRRGKATAPLASFRWEEHWETPVSAVRERLHCPA